ncbi:hypothetical protein [Lacipirellula parvula]|uniref:Uncharacterized protein n=1 Tax=Lacipirellula parvula TaxID=2650471 RepID=A0A5K7X4K9_9BACT|nr:hypothetical protein [Lacipirellula parvula]BBO31325.1 hypothetical protein PLANPX_0937 [Lacipirellula parvula]
MQRQYIRQRERVFTEEMKVKFCRLVRESYSLAEAAQGVGVTLRTVQRYRREEEDFDQEVRMAKLAKPDPLKLMESAARTHWRAAAWLLERTKPETYARKRGDLASGLKVTKALRLMMETALANTPEEARSELFKHLDKTYEHALDCCFPSLGPWDRPREPKMADTPLVFRERAKSAPVIHNYGLGTPDEWSFAAKPEQPRSHAPRGNAESDAPRREPNADVTPPPTPTLAPGSSNRGQSTPPPLTEAERAQRHQDLLDWGLRLMQNEQRQKDRDKYDHLMSRKTKKATQATRQQNRQQNRRRAA